MKTKDWKLIAEKQAEIINLYEGHVDYRDTFDYKKKNHLESELSVLESQEVEGENEKSFRQFLTSKAMFTWSEIDHIENLYKEYAQQSSNVTDEDIEKYFSLEKSTSGFIASKEYNQMQQYKIEGALAMKYNLIKPE